MTSSWNSTLDTVDIGSLPTEHPSSRKNRVSNPTIFVTDRHFNQRPTVERRWTGVQWAIRKYMPAEKVNVCKGHQRLEGHVIRGAIVSIGLLTALATETYDGCGQ